jgi:predicted phage baseplate assembly protein
MSFPLPDLDDRRWDDLVAEGLSLVTLLAPEWTDFNAHDPGVTLIELFSWLTEMSIYQLNRVGDAERRKFLALVGVRPGPPREAETVLAFALAAGRAPRALPEGLEFQGVGPARRAVGVRTLGALTVVPGQLRAVQVDDGTGPRDLTGRWQRGASFPLFGNDPRPGAALYLGFDTPFPPDVPVSLAFTVADPDASRREREGLLVEARERREACLRPPPGAPCGPAAPAPETAEEVPPHHSVSLVWEYPPAAGGWAALAAVDEDTTRALTLDGRVVIRVPGASAARALGHVAEPLYYLRVRFASGAYDAAPALLGLAFNGVAAAQAVVPDRATTAPPADSPLPVESLSAGTGWPNLNLNLSQAPVVSSSVRVFSREAGAWQAWELRADLDASGRNDRHAVLDPTQGTLAFGDGEHGWVLPRGAEVVACSLSTLAGDGNLATGTAFSLSDNARNRALLGPATPADVKGDLAGVTNTVALAGGAAAETLTHAEGRAFGLAEVVTRAVTLADVEALALATPGTRVARALALANVHPDFPCLLAPGVVTLIVVPFLPVARPSPSPGLLRAVSAALSRRRVIGTRTEVIGPNYTEVTVRATVALSPGASASETPRRVVAALATFLDPLTGGPAGGGWPFRRDVVRAEVMAVIAGTSGVAHVASISLSADGGPPQCGNLCLGFAGLVASGAHQITVAGEIPC